MIHISDLHARVGERIDQEVVVEALFKDLRRLCDETPVDLVLVSGDIAFAADPAEYEVACTAFLVPLMGALGIEDRNRVVLVPGNHDVQRAAINRYEEAGLRAELAGLSEANALLDDAAELVKVTARMTRWRDFVHEFYGNEDGEEFNGLLRFHRLELATATVGVAAYNSAWRSSGDDDQGHLLIGDRVIKAGAACAAGTDLRIAIMHHPPTWLIEYDSRQLNLALDGSFHLLLTGHLHEAAPAGVQRPGGGYLHSATGAVYGDDGRSYANCYTILDIDLPKRSVIASFREYQPKREEFDAAVSVAEGGRAEFSLPTTAIELASASGEKLGVLSGAYMEKREQASQDLAAWITEQSVIAPVVDIAHGYRSPVESLQVYMVEPYFQRVPREELAAPPTSEVRKPLTTADVLGESADKVLIISGEGGNGITTALTWTLLHIAELEPGHFPLLLHAHSDVSAGQRAFDTACRKGLTLAGLPLPIDSALPPLLVAINDADKLSDRKVDRLAHFVHSNPGSRFVLGCRRDHLDRISRRLMAEEVDFATVHVGPLGRRHLRSLVRKAVRPADEDRVLALVSAVAGNTFAGRAPFVVAALISLAAAEEAIQNVTDNVAITRSYAELLLGRNDRFEDSRVQMTYRNREHIMQRVASKMLLEGDSGVISRGQLESFLRAYFDSVGWELPVSYVVDDLVKRWVLFEARPNEYAFRQKPMHAFFAAGHAMENDSFRDFILSDPLRWSSVIEYMAGLPKNDEKLLTTLHGSLPPRPIRGGTFAIESEPLIIDDVAEIDEASQEPDTASASQEDLDDAFDPMLYGDPSFQLATVGMDSDPAIDRFIWTRLVSNVLRSSELVENPELKKDVLGSLVERWGDVADGLATQLQGLVLEHGVGFREFVIQMTGESDDGQDFDADRFADLFSMLGVAIALWGAGESLGSLKLDNALAPLTPDHPIWQDPAAALVATALHADARSSDWLKYAFRLLDDYGKLEAVRTGVLALSTAQLHLARSRRDREDAERLFVRAALKSTTFANDAVRNIAEAALLRRLRLWMRPVPAAIDTE